jgi:hypothetical protein
MGLPTLACQIARQQTGQPVGESRASIENRLVSALVALKLGQSTLLGAIGEETSACYLLGVSRVQTSAGAPASVLRLRTTAAIKGRILEFHQVAHNSPGKELAALHRFTDTMKRTIQLHMAANE